MGYDFSQLHDKEFEILVTDLLSKHLDVRIERFKQGKDKGVDGRFFSNSDKEEIIQCKHYLKTGYKGLINKLKKEEADKVKKLSPEKYYFITSLSLARDNKKEIRKIFEPYIKRDDDIFGQEDLNDLLSFYPEIEEKHFKLWITSTTVLERILNNAIKGRSGFELERIKDNSYKYVQTKNHDKAIEILENEGVLIISGEPGIGKTTLAENLCLFYASQKFEFIDIEESLSEAEAIYKRDKRQVFYFDDFLGSNYFEAISNKKDSHIIKFIERVAKDKTKRFILTSRTNILNSGVLHSPILANNKIQKREFLLQITSLTDLDRARILYNHIWHSNLKEEFIEVYYTDKQYRKVIKHKNYNPRLIEFITDVDRITVSDSSEYWSYIKNTLDNPKEVWADCFKRQNNAFVRNLVNLAVFNGGEIAEDELRESYLELNKIEGQSNKSHTEKDFESMSQLATKSFINRTKAYSEIKYSLFNPSIADFVIQDYIRNFDKIKSIFQSLNTVKSLKQLQSLQLGKYITNKKAKKLKKILFADALKRGKAYDYLIFLARLLLNEKDKKKDIIGVLEKIIEYPKTIKEFSSFLSLLLNFKDELKIEDYSFLIHLVGNRYLDESEIREFLYFIETISLDDESILDYIREEIESSVKAELDFTKDEIDINQYINHYYYDGWYDEVDIDRREIERELEEKAWELIYKFESSCVEHMEFNIAEIISDIDINEMVNKYLKSHGDDTEGFSRGTTSYDQDIDDLFDRG